MHENIAKPNRPESEELKVANRQLKKRSKWLIICLLWTIILGPLLGIYIMLNISDDGTLPGFDELENPQSNLCFEGLLS